MMLFIGLVFLLVHSFTLHNFSVLIAKRYNNFKSDSIRALIEERLVFHHNKEVLQVIENINSKSLFRHIFDFEDPLLIKSHIDASFTILDADIEHLDILEMQLLRNDHTIVGSWQSEAQEHVNYEEILKLSRKLPNEKILGDSHFMTSEKGNPVHSLIYPIKDSTKNYGYLVFVTSPLAILEGMGEIVQAELDVKNLNGEIIISSPYDFATASGDMPDLATLEIPIFINNEVPFMNIVVRYDNALSHGTQVTFYIYSILFAIFGIWMSLMFARYIMNISIFRRISEISDTLGKIGRGERNIKLPYARNDELSVLREQLGKVIVYEMDQWKMANDLIDARKEAEISNKAKSEFLANMSHELRTPLNAIIGFSDILSSDNLPEQMKNKTHEYATDIRDSGVHLLNIINDILDLSKIESGNITISKEKCDIHEIIEMSIRLVQASAYKKHISIENMIMAGQPELMVDNRMIQQAIINILTNAVKFTLENGIIVINAGVDNEGKFCIAISDNGIGISEDQIEVVTKPFSQVDSTYTREHEGTGLGLSLVKGFMELHEGSLSIDSVFGVGTTIFLSFPESCIMPDTDSLDNLMEPERAAL